MPKRLTLFIIVAISFIVTTIVIFTTNSTVVRPPTLQEVIARGKAEQRAKRIERAQKDSIFKIKIHNRDSIINSQTIVGQYFAGYQLRSPYSYISYRAEPDTIIAKFNKVTGRLTFFFDDGVQLHLESPDFEINYDSLKFPGLKL